MVEKRITDDIDKLRSILPPSINRALDKNGDTENLLEIILDLGRVPTARYLSGEVVLSEKEINRLELDAIAKKLHFDADNRAGLPRTLHRISAIRNRRGEVVGVTCRVGRAVYGTIDILEELVKSGRSLLMLGAPGVGKTTMLREAARVLADFKRVVIVDTSNEIGGDGDVAHPAIGRARRMQVSHPERQHEVMIEAVENHNPEVIVIDEIGRELEARAARTIAERGVQLIGTAHGNALENLMLNPVLSDLIGGIESVTLSDEEAKRRGTQKTVLERRAPPTFEILVELQSRDRMVIHEDVATSVDGMLRNRPGAVELRTRDDQGHVRKEMVQPSVESRLLNNGSVLADANTSTPRNGRGGDNRYRANGNGNSGSGNVMMVQGAGVRPLKGPRAEIADDDDIDIIGPALPPPAPRNLKPITVHAYGVARNRLSQSARRLNVPLNVTDNFDEAEAIVTLKSYYRTRPKLIVDAERRGMPVYVLRASTVSQIENFLVDVFKLEAVETGDPFGIAMTEVEEAISRIQAGEESVALTPQASHIRRQQHMAAREAGVYSVSSGTSEERFVRLLRDDIA
jgi:stage III sporulation protein SpoIIIAA